MTMSWFRRKPQPEPVVRELTAEEKEAWEVERLVRWHARNPVKTYVITYASGDCETITAHGYRIFSGGWTHFYAWAFEGFDSSCNTEIVLLKFRTGDLFSVRLHSPIPETLRVDV